MDQRSKKLVLILVAAPIAVLLFLYCFEPGPHADWTRPDLRRRGSTARIATALSKYKIEHGGNLPDHLSQLVPEYVPSSRIDIFFGRIQESKSLGHPGTLGADIDSNGAFRYLGANGIKHDLVLFERNNFWPKDLGQTNVMTVTSNLTLQMLSGREIMNRIGGN